MQRAAAKFAQRLMSNEQKHKRLEVSQEVLDRANNDENFLKHVIIGDVMWVCGSVTSQQKPCLHKGSLTRRLDQKARPIHAES
jgi:hypothetical protein